MQLYWKRGYVMLCNISSFVFHFNTLMPWFMEGRCVTSRLRYAVFVFLLCLSTLIVLSAEMDIFQENGIYIIYTIYEG